MEEQKAAGKTSAKDVTEYIRNMGYDVTADDIEEAMERDDKGMVRLDDEELDGVAGGAPNDGDTSGGTYTKCPHCERKVIARPTGKNDGAFFLWRRHEYICPVCNEAFRLLQKAGTRTANTGKDVRRAYNAAKANGVSFFLSYFYAILCAVNEIHEFHYRFDQEGNVVW